MRLRQRSLRHLAVWLGAALTAFGLVPVAAHGAMATAGAAANLALNKPVEASSTTQNYVAANANDGSTSTYWESSATPATLTVKLGADADLDSVVLKLSPDPAWAQRTQSIEVLGRAQAADGFSTVKARTDYTFAPGANQNTVTIPVSGRYADLQLKIHSNTSGYGAQIAEFQVNGTAAPNPDLTVSALTWEPAQPSERDAVTVHATVRNIGSAPSAATTVDVGVGGSVSGSAEVGALDAGASATVPVSIGKRAQGSYTVSAVVDPRDTVVEQNNDNNSLTAAGKLTVGQSPGPDLEVTDITSNPASPAVGSVVTFTVKVHNRGTSAVAAGSVTRLTVGGATLNGTTPALDAGRALPSPSAAAGPPPAAAPRSPLPPTPPASSTRRTRTTTSSRGPSSSAGARRCRTSSTRRRTGSTTARSWRPIPSAPSDTPTSPPSPRAASRCVSTRPASTWSSPRRARPTRSSCATPSPTRRAAAARRRP